MKKIKFNRSIYSDDTINKTIISFKNHAIMSVNFTSEYATITFWKCKFNEAQTIKEFENYLIGIENS